MLSFFLPQPTERICDAIGVRSPMRILSLENSRSFIVTISFSSTAAFRAAWFTRFSSSAPEKPTVPLAIISASTAGRQQKVLLYNTHQYTIVSFIAIHFDTWGSFTLRPTRIHFDLGEVPVQNFSASFHVRAGNGHLHVEPSRPYQGTKNRTSTPSSLFHFPSLSVVFEPEPTCPKLLQS